LSRIPILLATAFVTLVISGCSQSVSQVTAGEHVTLDSLGSFIVPVGWHGESVLERSRELPQGLARQEVTLERSDRLGQYLDIQVLDVADLGHVRLDRAQRRSKMADVTFRAQNGAAVRSVVTTDEAGITTLYAVLVSDQPGAIFLTVRTPSLASPDASDREIEAAVRRTVDDLNITLR